MTRFRTAVEAWKGIAVDVFLEVVETRIRPAEMGPAKDILLDVVKAVESYERTIADLKHQNSKLRRGRK